MENQNKNTNVSPVSDGIGQPVSSGFVTPEPVANDTEALSQYQPTPLAEPIVSQVSPKSSALAKHSLKRIGIAVIILVLLGLGFLLYTYLSKKQTTSSSATVATQYATQQVSLTGITVSQQGLQLTAGNVIINGPLKLNEGVVITPSVQPNAPVSGQLYYDQNTNQLAYYNGTAFVPLTASGQVVQSIGGVSGQLTLGGGLNVVGNQLGVTFPQTVIPPNVSSLGGKTGDITLGSGLTLAGNELQNKGVLNVLAGTNIAVTNDGAGNYTVINTGAGTGTVSSSGGTNGTIPLFTAAQNIENSIITQTGLTVTVTGDLSIVTGGLSLTNALTVSNGGTGANSLAANGVIVGSGTAALTSVAAGSAGLCLVSTAGAPTWAACPGGSGVSTLNGLSGALTVANASAAGSTITIDDASTTTKGIASFNSTNFTASGGTINTVQNINTGATPTFAGLNTNSITPSAAMTVGVTTQTLLLQGSTATITSTGAGNDITLNSADTIELQDNTNVTGNLDVSGTLDVGTANALQVAANGNLTTAGIITAQGGSVTAGAALQAGNIILYDGSSNTGTIQTASLGQNTVYNLPDPGQVSVDICLSTGNCAGSGSGVTTSGGTLNRLAKFTAAQAVNDSTITDDGTNVTTSVDVIIQGGNLTMGVSSSQTGSIDFHHASSAFIGTIVQGALTGNHTYTLPNSSGDICLSSGNCAGSGSPYTLQAAYDAGNTVATTTNRDIAFTLADTTADSNFTITTATNSSGSVSIARADGSGTIDPAQLLLLDNLDADRVQPIGLKIQAAGGGMTTAIDVSDPEIVDAISLGANNIVGTTGDINFTNFDLTGSTGTITSAGNAILQGGSITAGTTTQAGGIILYDGSSNTGTIQTASLGQNTVYSLPDPGIATVNICLSTGNCAGAGTGVTTTGGTIGTIPVFTASQQIADSLLSQAAGTVTVAGNLNLTTGSQFQINSTQISSANLSNDSNLAKLSASQTFTGNTVAFQNGSNSVNAFNIQNSTGNRILTVDTSNNQILLGLASTLDGKLVFSNVSNANTVTIQPGTPTANRVITLPNAGGILCTDSGNCAGAGSTLQTSYNFSTGGTTPKIKVNDTLLGVDIQDADTTIAADLFDVRASNASGLGSVMFGVGSTGQITMQNAANSATALRVLTQGGTGVVTIDTTNGQTILGQSSTLAGTLVFSNATNANKISIVPSAATANRTLTLPNVDGTICTDAGNCAGAGVTLQSSYNNSTNPEIVLDATRGALTVRDNATPLAANLFEVQNNAGGTNYFSVDASGVGITGALIASGNINTTSGTIQTNATNRIDNSGNLVNIGTVSTSGAINSQTISSASNFTGTVTIQGTNALTLGTTGTNTGAILFKGATGASGTLTLLGPANPSTNTITLPNETGTVCTTGSVCTGYAPASGSGSYIQNGTSTQTADFHITGSGTASTLQAYTLDSPDASALGIGTTNATVINLNQNTAIAATKTLTVTSGLTSLTGNTTGDALNVSNSTSTGNIAVFKDNTVAALTIANGGSTSIVTNLDSTTAFSVQGTAGSIVMSADTINNTAKLRTVNANNASTFDAIWLQGNKNGVTALIGGNDDTSGYTANELSGNLRFNGSGVGWGDFGYYPTGGGDGNYGQFRLSTTGSAINTTPNAKLGVGDLYVTNEIGINNTSPTEALDVTGNINIGSANGYKIGSVIAVEASGGYLRINQANQFANGIYTGTSGVRIGGTTGLLVGSVGGDGQIGLIPSGADNTRRITLDGGTGAIQGYTEVLSGATSGDALSVSNGTSTGNIALFKDNSTTVGTIADGGATTFQNSTNSTAAFRVLSSGGSSLFSIDSTNGGAATLLGLNSGETGSWSSTTTTLTGTRGYTATAIANGYVYVVGGNSGTTPQSTVYYAKINSNGTTGSWTTNTYALPVATAYTTATVQNGYLYVLGGSNSGGTEQTTVYFTHLNSDGSTGSWYTTTALPAARSNGKALSVNGYMYYIGGQSTTDTAQSTTYYSKINSDGTLGTWTTGTAITNARKSAQVITANGYIYVAGGVGNTGTYQTSVYYATLDPGTGAIGTFASTSALPGVRAEGSPVIANGYMYVIGGRDSSTYQTSVYYSKLSGSDGTAGAWATATNALPAARGGSGAFIANGYAYMIGGYDGSTTTSTVYSASVARVQIGASLDLVGLQTSNMTSSGDTTQGGAGGSITAGNGTFVGSMQVQGITNLSQGLNVNGITTLTGNTYIAGTLSLSSELAAYEGFENVTFPPSGGTGTWTTGGNANWARSTTVYEEGAASAASGAIADSQSSWLDMDYTWSQNGSLTFAWRVSSEAGYDYLVVCVDNDSTCSSSTDYSYRLSGESGWQQLTIPMTAGTHSVRWLYGKDSSTAAGSDMGWVDNVRFNGGEGKIAGNGINFSPATGYNVTIGDNESTAALLVLDRYNDSSDPPGTNGGMYYNTSLAKFRCFEDSTWKDCISGPQISRFYQANVQSVPTGTDTRIVFDGTYVDNAPVTVTDNNKFTLNRAGTWLIETSVRFAAGSGGTGERYVYIADSVPSGQPYPRYGGATAPASSSYGTSLNASGAESFTAGTVISVYTYQSSAGALNTEVYWNCTEVSLTWLGY